MMTIKSWADFHVEPMNDPDDWSDDGSVTENPHKRAIWKGINLTTMYNDEVHGVKNETIDRTISDAGSVENTE